MIVAASCPILAKADRSDCGIGRTFLGTVLWSICAVTSARCAIDLPPLDLRPFPPNSLSTQTMLVVREFHPRTAERSKSARSGRRQDYRAGKAGLRRRHNSPAIEEGDPHRIAFMNAQDRDRTIADSTEKSSDSAKGAAKSAAIDPMLTELLAGWNNLPPVIKSAILAVARQHQATE